jgi:predicted MFS family arabinose efflux permease
MSETARGQSRMGLVVAASAAGTVFEWYDFFIFGSLAAIIARHFFSGVGEAQAYLLALLTFAAGFVARPFGAVVFGWFGDRVGRKRTFLVTITVMGLATFAVAFLPDYAAIGMSAPFILVTVRVLQGFAIGGEYGGAAIYVAEHASRARRGSATGWIQTAAGIGLLLALIVILAIRTAMGENAFAAWGWRIPFGLSVILLLISLWIRLRLQESPAFRRIQEEGTQSKAPLRDAFLDRRYLKVMIAALLGLLTSQGVVWYTAQFYTLFFMERITRIEPATVTFLIMVVTVASLPLYMFFAWISDHIGRKPVMLLGLGLATIGFIPGFQMLTAAANPALAHAAAKAPIVVTAAPADCSLQFDLIGKAKFVTSCDIAKGALAGAGIGYRNESAAPGTLARVRIGNRAIESPDGRGLSPGALAQAQKDFTARLKAALTKAGYPAMADPARIDFWRVLAILFVFIVAATALYGPQAAALVELFPTRIRYTALSVPYHIGVGWFGGFLPATAFAIVAATGNLYAGLWYPVIVSGIGFLVTLFFLPETFRRELED